MIMGTISKFLARTGFLSTVIKVLLAIGLITLLLYGITYTIALIAVSQMPNFGPG